MLHITSDTHDSHKNILGFPSCNKFRYDLYGPKEDPESVVRMNEGIVKIWNQHVSPQDTVYHLGDVSLAYGKKSIEALHRFLSSVNGKITLLRGNHDHKETRKMFEMFGHEVKDYLEIEFEKVKVCMSHYPFASWNKAHHGSVMLHGHSHGSYTAPGGRILDVGWDVHGRPLTMKEAVDICLKKPVFSTDHH